MGEVYRARDPRLGREVAVKILPEAFSQDPARLARFDREARALAALNHPGIAGIHGIEEADSGRFLVLELVEGETLAARLSRGPLRQTLRTYSTTDVAFATPCWTPALASSTPLLPAPGVGPLTARVRP
jgi:serine/threonine protein kinase